MSISEAELAALHTNSRVDAVAPEVQALAALAQLAPEIICRKCFQPLDVRDADLGTHATCDPQQLPGTPPPSTVQELVTALVDYERNSARSQQAAIGPSEIGVDCDRRLGYTLRGAPKRSDDAVKWAALVGGAVHQLIADALLAANQRNDHTRWLVEQQVWPDPAISGSCDAYDVAHDIVVDWKVVGESTIVKARRQGPTEQYRKQAHIYGRGWQRLGHAPKWVRIVYLPRWAHVIDKAFEWTAPYSRLAADRALARLHNIEAALTEANVDATPGNWAKIRATPTSDACYFCPYHYPNHHGVDFGRCSGYRAKAEQAVDAYLDSLPSSR